MTVSCRPLESEGIQRSGPLALRIQAVSLFLFFSIILWSASAIAQEATTKPSGRSIRRQLDDACDLLRKSAVKSPYGWGWPSDIEPRPVEKVSSRNRIEPDIDIPVTAAAGLVLELAGRELKSEANHFAAVQASRAIASVQLSTGQIPYTARLVPKPSGHQDNSSIVPNREPTRAALALMLIVIEADKEKTDDRIDAATSRAATWLIKQQTGGGGWQSAYPPGAGVKSRRLILLDDPDFRDSTFTLLLASRVLGRREYALMADRCIDQLLRLRIQQEGSRGRGLWNPAYNLGGEAVRDIDDIPHDIDLLASRYAMETLLAAHLIADRKNLGPELSLSARAALALPKTDGRWQPRYPMFPRKAQPAPPSDETNNTSNDTTDPDQPKPQAFDDAGLLQLLSAIEQSQKAGVQKFALTLWTEASPTERLAATVCHLSEDMLTMKSLGVAKTNPTDLPAAVTKAWELLRKVKNEPKMTPPATQ